MFAWIKKLFAAKPDPLGQNIIVMKNVTAGGDVCAGNLTKTVVVKQEVKTAPAKPATPPKFTEQAKAFPGGGEAHRPVPMEWTHPFHPANPLNPLYQPVPAFDDQNDIPMTRGDVAPEPIRLKPVETQVYSESCYSRSTWTDTSSSSSSYDSGSSYSDSGGSSGSCD